MVQKISYVCFITVELNKTQISVFELETLARAHILIDFNFKITINIVR